MPMKRKDPPKRFRLPTISPDLLIWAGAALLFALLLAAWWYDQGVITARMVW